MKKVRWILSIMLIFLMVLSMSVPLLAGMQNVEDKTIIGVEENSIYFEGVTIGGTLTISEDDNEVRIVASGTSEINVNVLASGTIQVEVESLGGGFEKIVIPASISKGSDVRFIGSFENVEINVGNINLDVDEDSRIKTVIASKMAHVLRIAGEGVISNAVIQADNVTLLLRGTTVIVDQGVEGTLVNGNAVEGGTVTKIEDDVALPTKEQYVLDADVDDYNTLYVDFAVDIDEVSALNIGNYRIYEKYGSGDEILVSHVELAVDDNGVTIGNRIALTILNEFQSAKLYTLQVRDVGTKYGYGYDSLAEDIVFSGVGREDAEYDIVGVSVISNTQIKVTMDRQLAAIDDYDLSLFSIYEGLNVENTLNVVSIDYVDENYMILNTGPQSDTVYYVLRIAEGFTFGDGHAIADEATKVFRGVEANDSISSMSIHPHDDAVTLEVVFDVNYGHGALEVANYSIDGGIGNPLKVEAVSRNYNTVLLTIIETNTSEIYDLVVNNVYNSDGVAMSKKGITQTFISSDVVAGPKLEAAVALDEQTIKLYFDTAIDQIESLNTAEKVRNALRITGSGIVDVSSALVYKDLTADNAYIVTLSGNSDSVLDYDNSSNGSYIVEFIDTELHSNYDSHELGANSDLIEDIAIEGLVSLDYNRVKVYFNQTVRTVLDGAITIDHDNNDSTARVDFIKGLPLDDAKKEWIFELAKGMTSTALLDVVVVAPSDITIGGPSDSHILFSDEYSDLNLTVPGIVPRVITDVVAIMNNGNTMKVYFPVYMDATTSEILTNYTANGLTPVSAVYDYSGTVTLSFDTSIPAGNYDLVLSTDIMDKDLTAHVAKSIYENTTDLTIQFAGSNFVSYSLTGINTEN